MVSTNSFSDQSFREKDVRSVSPEISALRALRAFSVFMSWPGIRLMSIEVLIDGTFVLGQSTRKLDPRRKETTVKRSNVSRYERDIKWNLHWFVLFEMDPIPYGMRLIVNALSFQVQYSKTKNR